MSLSQLSGKGINYASNSFLYNARELRHKRSPNELHFEEMNRDNLNYIESLLKKPSMHQRAKSTLDKFREPESEKLFDQFFKLNNSKSDTDLMPTDFMKFLENSVEYHNRSEVKFFKQPQKNTQQQLKEATMSNRLLANELNKYKQHALEYKQKMKAMQKEFQAQFTQQVQKVAWLEDLLAKQKIDNENSLLAVKKTVEMLSTKCKCKNIQGLKLYDKLLKDVKTRRYANESEQTHTSQSDLNEDDDLLDYKFFDNRRRKSISKVYNQFIQTSEEQEQLVQSFIQGKNKNPREYQYADFSRKRSKDPYYIEEENTINST